MWGPLTTSRLRHCALASADKAPDSCCTLPDRLPYLVFSWGMGLVTFPSCLGLIQVLVFRPLRLTCATWGSSFIGLGSVGVSGLAASAAVIGCAAYLLKSDTDSVCSHKVSGFQEMALWYGISSSVVFMCLGGRFRSVLPSSLIHPGAFARQGLSATFSYATARKKRSLRVVGKRHGCHTCGRRWLVKDFIADHQPPLAVLRSPGSTPEVRFPHRVRHATMAAHRDAPNGAEAVPSLPTSTVPLASPRGVPGIVSISSKGLSSRPGLHP